MPWEGWRFFFPLSLNNIHDTQTEERMSRTLKCSLARYWELNIWNIKSWDISDVEFSLSNFSPSSTICSLISVPPPLSEHDTPYPSERYTPAYTSGVDTLHTIIDYGFPSRILGGPNSCQRAWKENGEIGVNESWKFGTKNRYHQVNKSLTSK